MTNDQIYNLITRIKDVSLEIKLLKKTIEKQNELLEKSLNIQEQLLKKIK